MASTLNKIDDVDGVQLFYREAGNPSAPHIVLLHGFPSSSHQYRHLIPILAQKYHVIAPDLPGYGVTVLPKNYKYTFENFAKVVGGLLDKLQIKELALYVFDYGAPTGFRLAVSRPDLKIRAFITQNGNAYEEGLGDFWAPIRKYWADGTAESRIALKSLLVLEATRWQYEEGVSKDRIPLIGPEAYYLDQAFMDRPGNKDIQLDLFYDYRTNLPLYADFQKYFRSTKVPLLATWGKNDQIFIPPGAEAYKRDLPNAIVKFYDTGHFALETHLAEISKEILSFLEGVYGR